jgi:galactonate dehydratase
LLPYANGWYGGAVSPDDFARHARDVLDRGYPAVKFDPFGTAWKEMDEQQMRDAERIVAAVRETVGERTQLMIEVHGRLSASCAIEMARRLARYGPAWFEEPVTPHSLDLLLEVKRNIAFPVAAGERLYTLEDFQRLTSMRACDFVQLDLAHCGGLLMGKKIAAHAEVQDMRLAPHCSIGPVALCAAVHFGWSTPGVAWQENFGDFDVAWRGDLVHGWQPLHNGQYALPERPGLGIELNLDACRQHPFQPASFPSLWDPRWIREFTKSRGTGEE